MKNNRTRQAQQTQSRAKVASIKRMNDRTILSMGLALIVLSIAIMSI